MKRFYQQIIIGTDVKFVYLLGDSFMHFSYENKRKTTLLECDIHIYISMSIAQQHKYISLRLYRRKFVVVSCYSHLLLVDCVCAHANVQTSLNINKSKQITRSICSVYECTRCFITQVFLRSGLPKSKSKSSFRYNRISSKFNTHDMIL